MTLYNSNVKRLGAIAIAVAALSGAYAARSFVVSAQDAIPEPTHAANPALNSADDTKTPLDPDIEAILSNNANQRNVPPTIAPPRPASQAYAPDFANEQAEIEELRAKIRTLQNQLNRIPTTLDEQLEQRKIVDELTATQAKIRELESTAGQFSAYKRYRDMQAGATSEADAKRAILDESGLSSNSVAKRIGGGSALTFGEAQTLREQKEALAQQYRQYQQTLRALQPGDEALAENLKKEQDAVLAQIKDINLRLVGAPASPEGAPNALNATGPINPASPINPPTFGAPGTPTFGMPGDVAVKMQKVEEAARLLRESGLSQLAGWVANEIPKLADPNYVETPLTLTSNANGTGSAAYNPFLQPAHEDLQTINDSITDLKARVETLADALANVEVQLKLLTRQTVDSASPVSPAATPAATIDAAPKAEPAATQPAASQPAASLPVDNLPELDELPAPNVPENQAPME